MGLPINGQNHKLLDGKGYQSGFGCGIEMYARFVIVISGAILHKKRTIPEGRQAEGKILHIIFLCTGLSTGLGKDDQP